jgi:hypothetical protein
MAVLHARAGRRRKAHPDLAADIMLLVCMILFVAFWGWIGYEVLRMNLH